MAHWKKIPLTLFIGLAERFMDMKALKMNSAADEPEFARALTRLPQLVL
jgi:hypothetical protein